MTENDQKCQILSPKMVQFAYKLVKSYKQIVYIILKKKKKMKIEKNPTVVLLTSVLGTYIPNFSLLASAVVSQRGTL